MHIRRATLCNLESSQKPAVIIYNCQLAPNVYPHGLGSSTKWVPEEDGWKAGLGGEKWVDEDVDGEVVIVARVSFGEGIAIRVSSFRD